MAKGLKQTVLDVLEDSPTALTISQIMERAAINTRCAPSVSSALCKAKRDGEVLFSFSKRGSHLGPAQVAIYAMYPKQLYKEMT